MTRNTKQMNQLMQQQDNGFPSLKELEDLELELKKQLVTTERNLYIQEGRYMKETAGTGKYCIIAWLGNLIKGWDVTNQANKPTVTATTAHIGST